MIVHVIHAVILQKKASLPPAKSGSFSPKSGSFLSFFARPRAIALGSKPLAGSSVRSRSACRPGDEAEATLLQVIKDWIKPGTTIVSDCWKAYVNLEKHGYIHKTVNHSMEFVNEEGFHTNKIEGHWRQMKAKLPTHGRKKDHYSSYLAEFKWRYIHRGEDLWKVFLDDVKKIFKL